MTNHKRPEDTFVNRVGLRIFYRYYSRPGRPTLCFIHPFPFTHEIWSEQEAAFSKDYSVLLIDLRSFGKSERGFAQLVDSWAEDLEELLNLLTVEKVILCGLSMGGYVALRFAERFRERVTAMILANTKSESDTDEEKIKRAEGLKSLIGQGTDKFAHQFLVNALSPTTVSQKPELVTQLKDDILRNSLHGIASGIVTLAARTDTTNGLERITCPVLVIGGNDDKIVPQKYPIRLQQRISGSELVLFQGVGHLSCIENPELFNSCIHEFLSTKIDGKRTKSDQI